MCIIDKIDPIASALSAIFSGGVLGWLIYQHLEKPKIKNLRIGIELIELTQPGIEPHIWVDGVNFGKDDLKLVRLVITKSRWRSRRSEHRFIPRNDSFPIVVSAGDYFTARFLSCRQARFLGHKDLKHLGVVDVFGKVHWVERGTLKTAQKFWLEDYNEDNG